MQKRHGPRHAVSFLSHHDKNIFTQVFLSLRPPITPWRAAPGNLAAGAGPGAFNRIGKRITRRNDGFFNQIPMFLHFHFSPPSEFRSAVVCSAGAASGRHYTACGSCSGSHQQHNGHHHHAQQQHTQHGTLRKRHRHNVQNGTDLPAALSAAAIPAELFFSMSSKPLMTNQVA